MLPKFFEKYPSYNVIKNPQSDLKNKYQPNPVLAGIWDEIGFGTFMNGYLRIVNPDDYESLYKESFSKVKPTDYVIATTAFADLLTWVDNDSIELLDFRHQRVEIINGDNLERFFERRLLDDTFVKSALSAELYSEAVTKLGVPAYDECFGYEPVLAAGGAGNLENLRIVNLIEHINIITQLVGPL